MTNENYSPDEIRLLDLCAASSLPALVGPDCPRDSIVAMDAYDLAAAMIAERRKRVGSKPARDPLYPQPKCGICGKAFLPHEPMISDSGRFGVEHLSCSPERHPQPEQERDEARAALAAVQPVLDAVARYCAAENAAELSLHWRPLRDYADRRRDEESAQQQGGAS